MRGPTRKETLEARARAADLLHRATAMAAETETFEEALQACVDMVCEYSGWPVGHVYLPCESGDLVPTEIWRVADRAAHANFLEATRRTRFAPGVGLPGRIARSGEPAWIENVHEDDNFLRTRYEIPIGVKGALGFPIRFGGRVAAVLEFFSEEARAPDADLLRLVRSLGEQVGRVLERRLARESLRRHEALFLRLAENAGEIFWIRDAASGELIYLNPAYEKVARRAVPQAGSHAEAFEPLVHPDDLAAYRRFHSDAPRGAGEIEYRIRAEDGAARWFRDRATPVASPESGRPQVAGVTADVTAAKEAERRMLDLSRAALDGQEAERRRVARELHDGVLQVLSAAKFWGQSARERMDEATSLAARLDLDRALDHLERAVGEIRAVARSLRPDAIEALGLAAAVRGLCEEFSQRTGIDVRLRVFGEEIRPPASVELTLYRILQEALRNVERHARASRVGIRLSVRGGRATLSVIDDGLGSAEGAGDAVASAGFGLSHIRERARAADGDARVGPRGARGYVVRVRIPFAGGER